MLIHTKHKPLRGELSVPGDKSITHRAVILGSLASGTTEINGYLPGADCLSTAECFRRLGIEIESGEKMIVHGRGLRGLRPDPCFVRDGVVQLDTGNSGTTTRILSGVLAPQNFSSVLSGDRSLNSRPMRRVMEPLRQMGARIESLSGSGCAPLRIDGSPLHGITWRSPVASAQVKSAILMAGLQAEGQTTVVEPALSRDHTERMLRAFGAEVVSLSDETGCAATVKSCESLSAQCVSVPGDISSAAFLIAAASIVPGSEILLGNVGINPTRAGILRVAENMGADIEIVGEDPDAMEPAANLLVRFTPLHGTTLEGSIIPTLIDELPAIAIMAAAAEGRTIIRDAAELRVKESDRIEAITENLRAIGVPVEPFEDGMIIEGIGCAASGFPGGAVIRTQGDHRIAMSFAVASLIADRPVALDNTACVDVSYPEFFRDLTSLL